MSDKAQDQGTIQAQQLDKSLELEAQERIKLSQELSNYIDTSEQNVNEETKKRLEITNKRSRLVSRRGFEIFDINEVHKSYQIGTPILR